MQLLARINAYYESLCSDVQLHVENCIIDFAVLPDRVMVVELNPFASSTGACLFDWSRDAALLRGEAPFEFRVLHAPLQIEELVDECLKELNDTLDSEAYTVLLDNVDPPTSRNCAVQ